jgi:beta-galactosidase
VEFEHDGPARWLGGYESGRTNSIFQSHLKLEAGINRVALRATREPGVVTLAARCEGLQSKTLTVPTGKFEVAHSFSRALPKLPKLKLPAGGFDLAAADTLPVPTNGWKHSATANRSQFIRRFSYSGPATSVRVAEQARDGKMIYVDRDYRFDGLPAALRGSDYIQAANADKQYVAVDLMEVAVRSKAAVFLAHDDRLPRPAWLLRQFKPTDLRVVVQGSDMTVYQYQAAENESLTLGPNSDTGATRACNMYVVFVNASRGVYAERPEP